MITAKVQGRTALLRFVDSVTAQLGMEFDKVYNVSIKPAQSQRTLSQLAYLHGVCYPTILREKDLEEQGWRKSDLHEYFLGEYQGWETLSGLGRPRVRPVQRSPRGKLDMSDFIAFVQQKAAEMGVYVPDPE